MKIDLEQTQDGSVHLTVETEVEGDGNAGFELLAKLMDRKVIYHLTTNDNRAKISVPVQAAQGL